MAPWLGAIVVIGAVLRLVAWRFQPFVTVDGTEYIRFAEALMGGRWFASIFPPGYPALIALARVVDPDRVGAAALVSFVCGALLPIPTWWLARRAAGDRWALGAAAAVALHPELARFSALSMSESGYLLALYGGLALAVAGRAFPAGLGLGTAFAIRPEALVPVLAVAIVELVQALRARVAPRRAATFALGFLALAVPCWLWFHATLGVWTPTPKLGAFHAAVTDWRVEEKRLGTHATHAGGGAALSAAIRELPVALAQYPANALVHGRSLLQLWPPALLLLSLAGLVMAPGWAAIPLLHLIAIPLLGLSGQPRFVLPALPALAALAVVPLARGRTGVRRAAWALAAAGVIWCGVVDGRVVTRAFDGTFDVQRDAGTWLSGVSEPGDPVMDRKPYVAFYAHRPYVPMPDVSYDSVLDAAVRDRVRWFVLDQRVIEIYRPQLEPLLYDAAFRDRERRLELVYVGGRVEGFGVGLFRVLQPGEAKTGQPPVVRASYLPNGRPPPAP